MRSWVVAGQIGNQGAAQGDIHHLDTAANSENRHGIPQGQASEINLHFITDFVHAVDGGALPGGQVRCIKLMAHVGTTGQEEALAATEKLAEQGGIARERQDDW